MAAQNYTGVSITPEARDDLRLFAAKSGGVLGQRVSITEALRLAVHIASAHLATDGLSSARALGITSTEEQERQ